MLFKETFISKISVGCQSDEVLNGQSFLPMSKFGNWKILVQVRTPSISYHFIFPPLKVLYEWQELTSEGCAFLLSIPTCYRSLACMPDQYYSLFHQRKDNDSNIDLDHLIQPWHLDQIYITKRWISCCLLLCSRPLLIQSIDHPFPTFHAMQKWFSQSIDKSYSKTGYWESSSGLNIWCVCISNMC